MPTSPLSVIQVLGTKNRKEVRYVKPSNTDGNLDFHLMRDTETSPAAEILAARTIRLYKNDAVPVHRNTKREKFYQLSAQSTGQVSVFQWNKGTWMEYVMYPGSCLIVPRNTHHCLFCTGKEVKVNCSLFIILSSQVDDAKWEPETDRLIENKHLRKKATK